MASSMCQQEWSPYGMRRGNCRALRPDLDGLVRSDALTGSVACLIRERRRRGDGAHWDGDWQRTLFDACVTGQDPRDCAS